jgi:hypothetical protein
MLMQASFIGLCSKVEDELQALTRKVHPVMRVLEKIELAWAATPEQASVRAKIVAQSLIEAGYLEDAEIWHGLVVESRER